MRSPSLLLATGFLFLASPAWSQKELESARNALAESLPDVAATRVERYLAADPELNKQQKSDALLLLGEAYLRSQQPAKALEVLQKLPPESASARSYWQGMAFAHQHHYSKACEKLSLVEKESPLYNQALFNALEIKAGQRDPTAAFALLQKLRQHNAEFLPDEVALMEAQLYLAVDELDKAREALAKLKKGKLLAPECQLLVGRIELAAARPDAALQAFENVLSAKTSPTLRTLALLGKSDTLLATEQVDEALGPLLSLLSKDPDEAILGLLPGRFELLLEKSLQWRNLAQSLTTFVKPETLGEDSNYATPAKLLACYYLSRISESQAASKLLQEIATLAPEGLVAARAHLQLAQISLQDGDQNAALESLQAAQAAAPDSPLAFRAADLAARLSLQEGNLEEAERLFAQAALHPETPFREQALLNQAVLQLSTDPKKPLSALSAKLDSTEAKVSLELERALAQAKEQSSGGRKALQQFLLRHPEHPRMAQARLALAQVLLDEPQPDFTLIDAQLAALPEELDRSLSQKSFRISHQLGVITNDWEQAVTWGEKHRKDFPQAENDPFFLLRLGESCFRDEDYNRARFLFSKTASLPDANELREIALYFSALSNLKIPTSEATAEALDTLDELVKRAGPLATRARLLKARTLLKSLGQARASLKILEGMPGKPGDQPEAALLTAEAYRELSANEPELAQRAVSIYQRLLDDPRTTYQLSNEIHYQLALTHRENGNLNLAIEPCMKVVDFENRSPDEKEVEFDYYYRCGFEAIDILLEAGRARAALILARKLSKTGGPGAEQAGVRAEQIQLDHLLWTD